MAVYLVSYDLDQAERDHSDLMQSLRDAGGIRVLSSAWLIEVSQTAVEVRQALKSHMDASDRVFVVEITADAIWAGLRMMEPSGDWLLTRR